MSNPFAPYDPSAGKQYPPVDPHKVARVEIFPPIGFARVGDSGATYDGAPDKEHDVQYYYGPEVPGITDHPFGAFRDDQGRIKRQAARFRVYAYDVADNLLGEINNSQKYQLTWSCHVANKKAAYYEFRGIYSREHMTALRNPDTDPVDQKLDGSPFDTKLEGRKRLIVDPGERTLTRGQTEPVDLAATFQGSRRTPEEGCKVFLGEMRTDDQGRLVFLGGSGLARSVQKTNQLWQPEIISEFDSIDWIDDMCDGWVSVRVAHPERPGMATEITPPRKATVCSAPPKFAWGIDAPTTLYDILENIYKSKSQYEEHAGTEFYKDIWPVLVGTYGLSWVNNKAFQGHGPGGFGNFLPLEKKLADNSSESQALREHIFGRLRKPDFVDKDQAHVQFMPRLSGDNGDALEPGEVRDVRKPIMRFAALTTLQYERFRAWKDGDFTLDTPLGKKSAVEDYPLSEQPALLARAMLEQAIGDPLYPGIEMFWIGKLAETYATTNIPKGLSPPFRVDHSRVLPGFLTRGLSLPWQSDFDQCNTHWWPSIRPDDVVRIAPAAIDSNELARDLLSPSSGAGSEDTVEDLDGGPSLVLSAGPRARWTEGLRDTPDDVSSAFFPGSTDMVQRWSMLGFVAKLDVAGTPVWVEQERVLGREALRRGYVPAEN